jgi:hypothetical protein
MFVGLYCLVPDIVEALANVRFETVIPWHRAGFRWFWCWKSRRRSGRPSILLEIHRLIQDMSLTNPLWGAPRIRDCVHCDAFVVRELSAFQLD